MHAKPPDDRRFVSPPSGALPPEEAAMPYNPDDGATPSPSSATERARRNLEQRLAGIPAVTGIILDRDARGEDVLLVYIRDEAVRASIPAAIDGVPIIVKTGEFDAYSGPQRGG